MVINQRLADVVVVVVVVVSVGRNMAMRCTAHLDRLPALTSLRSSKRGQGRQRRQLPQWQQQRQESAVSTGRRVFYGIPCTHTLSMAPAPVDKPSSPSTVAHASAQVTTEVDQDDSDGGIPSRTRQGYKWEGVKVKELMACIAIGVAFRYSVPIPEGVTQSAWGLLSIFLGTSTSLAVTRERVWCVL